MIYFNAFIFCGIVCLIGQIILENTKLTPGHLNTIFVIAGSVLSGFGIYEKFIYWAGAGATVPITNFGQLLTSGAIEGFKEFGFIGVFTGLLVNASAGLCITIIISWLVAFFCKPKN